MLNKLDEKLTHVIQQAAAAGSLLSTKAARDLQLEVDAARQQLHNELNTQWDRLDQEKISGLREIDKAVDDLSLNIKKAGDIEDDLSLDVDQKLSTIPFLKTSKTIRRIDGSSQYFKTEGLYTIGLKGNLFDQLAGQPEVLIGNGSKTTTCPDEGEDGERANGWRKLAVQSVLPKPPYTIVINIPTDFLKADFQDRALSYVPVCVKQKVSNRTYAFQVWRTDTRTAEYGFKLELFPRYPAGYRLTEYDEEPMVDPSKTEIAPAKFMYVPGCGNSGCNAYYDGCTDVPAGAQPIQPVDFQDSFRGWGGFGAWRITSTGICATYWQHSHNTGRNVGFNVQYHPLSSHTVPHDINLVSMSPDEEANFKAKDQTTTQLTSLSQNAIWTVKSVQLLGMMISIPINLSSTVSQTTPPISVGNVAPAQLTAIDHGSVRFGRTYSAQFSNNMKSFDLVFRTFTGQELVVTPAKNDKLVEASPLENQTTFKRMTVSLKEPW